MSAVLEPPPAKAETPLDRQFEVTFFDKKGGASVAEMSVEDELLTAESAEAQEHAVYESGERHIMERGFTSEFKLCHINNVPDVKTEIVYRTYKLPFGKTIRVPTVAVRKRFCDTDFVITFTVADEKIVPILRECSVAAAAVAAPIIIAGCVSGVAAPAALTAGLQAFEASVSGCIVARGFNRNVFDLKLDQRKSCSAWRPMV